MSTAKKIVTALLIAVAATNVTFAQDKMEQKMDQKMELKEHHCTSACKDGKHMYAHGEKGHVCTKACKKMMKKNKM